MRRGWQGLIWRGVASLALPFAMACGAASDQPAAQAEEVFRVPVTLGRVERRDLEITSEIVGQLAPWREVTVAPEVGGNVATLSVELGAGVASGEELFRIDSTNARMAVAAAEAQLARAEATRRNAESSLARYNNLAGEGVVSNQDQESSQRDLSVAEAEVRSATAALDIARENLRDCIVRSPIGGEVTRRHIEVGQNLSGGTPAVDLADLSRVKMRAEVSERERVALTVGASVEVRIDALGDESFAGRIHALGSSANEATRTFPIEIEIANPEHRLLAGMVARAMLVLERRPGSLVAPLGARVDTLAGEGVFVVSTADNPSGEARFVPVEFGDRFHDVIEVRHGLSDGQEVVAGGAEALREGTSVRVDAESSEAAVSVSPEAM